MKVVLQRVTRASVSVEGDLKSEIGPGLLIFLGIEHDDTEDDISYLVKKVTSMRIFNDDQGKMNHSCEDVGGDYLVISQFTLHADTRKGNRPSYIRSARPETAIPLYEKFISILGEHTGKTVRSGVFGAHMLIDSVNDGPVTIIVDSKNR